MIWRKSSKLMDPFVQITWIVDVTHLLFIVADDLNEATHDVWEKGDATKHDYYCKYALFVAYWKVVAVAYSAQGCQGKVTAD